MDGENSLISSSTDESDPDVVSLAARRWERSDGNPASHTPIDCLEKVLADLRDGSVSADHVVVILGTDSVENGNNQYYQAGSFSAYAQLGLLQHTLALMLG